MAAACMREGRRQLGFRKGKLTEGAPVVGGGWFGGGEDQQEVGVQGRRMHRLQRSR
jgi:hypothetical protein